MLNCLEGPIWIALGIVVSLLSYRTGVGILTEPGAGFVALASGLFLVVVGISMGLVRGRASRRNTEEQRGGAEVRGPLLPRFLRLAYLVALLVFYGVLLEPLGYVITTFVFMFGLFVDLEKRHLAPPLFASLASVAVTYTIFEIWLKTQLPRGLFPWW